MVRDLGALRQPALFVTLGSGIVFLVLCWVLHRRDGASDHQPQTVVPAGVSSGDGLSRERATHGVSTCRRRVVLVAGHRFRRDQLRRLPAARAAPAVGGQAGAVRVRHRAEPRAAGALPGQLLRRRDAVHHVRHRDHLPLPVRGLARRAGDLRVRRDPHLLGAVLPDVRLRGRPRRSRLGSAAALPQPRRRCQAPWRPSGPSPPPSGGSGPKAGRRPRKRPERWAPQRPPRRRPGRARPQRDHQPARGPRQVGPVAQLVAGQLRPRLLRHRDDGHRRRPLRPLAGSAWRSSGPRRARPTS